MTALIDRPARLAAARTGSCPHTPPCPVRGTPGADGARIAFDCPEQGWTLLCNGMILADHKPLGPGPLAPHTLTEHLSALTPVIERTSPCPPACWPTSVRHYPDTVAGSDGAAWYTVIELADACDEAAARDALAVWQIALGVSHPPAALLSGAGQAFLTLDAMLGPDLVSVEVYYTPAPLPPLPTASLSLLRELDRLDQGEGVVFEHAPRGRWRSPSGRVYNSASFHPLTSAGLIDVGNDGQDPVRISAAARAGLALRRRGAR
jgi:hypothetical protein